MKTPIYLILCVSAFLCSCVSSHEAVRRGGASSRIISSSDSVLIIAPPDAVAVDDNYPNSGRVVAQRLAESLTPYVARVSVGSSTASRAGFTRIIEPSILQWEDHATAWSGIPDRISISLTVSKLPSHEILDSTLVKAKSSWWTLGGDHPEKLLPLAFGDYAKQISGR